MFGLRLGEAGSGITATVIVFEVNRCLSIVGRGTRSKLCGLVGVQRTFNVHRS